MPPRLRGRAARAAVLCAALVVAGITAFASLGASPATLALLAAAFILAEALQRADDELLPEPLGGERFSLSAPVHVAAILVAGPWPAALLGAVGTWAVRPFKGEPWRTAVVKGIGLAAAAVAGGYALRLAGAHPGDLRLPEDLLPVAIAGIVYTAVRTLLLALGRSRVVTPPDTLTAAAELGLGLGIALAAIGNLWHAVALLPVLLLLDRIYGRLVATRREMATALETFANIVDERDPTTYGHSLRVAGYVRELAEGLGLPRPEASRLWWAGRLHDLGKVAVDAVVLRKPGKLTPAEWSAVWRAPRLSARLLQRFRFAAQQAQAVEYHRERYNGSGYYRAQPDDIPLAAHFLIVADSFDAMTSDRPFRERLTHDEALSELERGSGTQFHPAVAKAFIAVRRGLDPAELLTAEELRAIQEAWIPARLGLTGPGELRRSPELVALGGAVVVLAGLGTHVLELVAGGAALLLVGLTMWSGKRLRAARLIRALDGALADGGDRPMLFERVVASLDQAWPTTYAALVIWEEDGSGGSVVLERGEAQSTEPVLVSWLLREAESGQTMAFDAGAELTGDGVSLALPLRRENNTLVGFLVLRAREHPPLHIPVALGACLDRLGLSFADAEPVVPAPSPPRAAKRLDARPGRETRALEA